MVVISRSALLRGLRRSIRLALTVFLGSLAAFCAFAGVAAAHDHFTAPPPGPPILYAPPPRAPQLKNAPGSRWHAQPILISGTSAYRDGEFLYQDYLYDDLGAGGTYSYPTNPAYAKDAADLVEFRLKPFRSGLLMRLTFNAMIDPSLVAATIALGGTPGTSFPLPFNAGAQEPAQTFVTVHGRTVVVTDAATGQTVDAPGAWATADLMRRQIQVFVPSSVLDTASAGTVRVAEASGLWDADSNQYLQPVTGAPTATQPGNGGTTGSALFNVGFRFGESGVGTFGSTPAGKQSAALKSGDLSQFFENVDFAKLRTHITDNMYDQPDGVPTHGFEDRIFASHFEFAQGKGPQPPTTYCHEPCPRTPDFAGQLQPYALYVPDKPAPPSGYGMTLNLHFCGGSYNNPPPDMQQLADRSTGSVVLSPEGRIPCGWWWSSGGADVFEAWADVARHFHLDPTYNAISGWSMGGYGTYKLLAQFPDLFARALPDIGCVSAETGWPGEPTPSISGPDAEILNVVPSFRNVPILAANANMDVLCDTSSQLQVFHELQSLGYRYDWREYVGGHGPFYPTADEAAAFLGSAKVDPNPPHVTYVLDGGMNEPQFGLSSDHAYWVSRLTLRDPLVGPELGTVDAFSHGFGLADPQPNPEQETSGTSGPFVFTGSVRTWQDPQPIPAIDQIDLNLTNIATVTIDVRRAHLNCRARINVTSDGPTVVHLGGCHRSITVS